MSRIHNRARGLLLASTTTLAVIAFAGTAAAAQCAQKYNEQGMLVCKSSASIQQASNETSGPTSLTHRSATISSPRASSQRIGRDISDSVLVEGDVDEINRRVSPPGGARLENREGHLTEITRQEWMSKGWSDAAFDNVEHGNRRFCGKTANYVVRGTVMLDRYVQFKPDVKVLKDRYSGMTGQISDAYNTSTGANVFQGVGGAVYLLTAPLNVATGLYGGSNILQAWANHKKDKAWKEMMEITRDAGMFTQDLNDAHVDFNLMSLETYQDYYGLVTDYCTQRYGSSPTR
jgi:hypothetical protein